MRGHSSHRPGRHALLAYTASGWVPLVMSGSRTRVVGDLARLPKDQLVQVWEYAGPEGAELRATGKAWAVLAQLTGWDWRRVAWRLPWQRRGRVWWRFWER